MNVLLISFSFPPAGGVGVLRALSLAKYLPESGIRVDVLTARNAPAVVRDEGLLQQVPDSVTVHRTWTLDLPFALRKGIKKVLSRGSKAARQPVVAPPKRNEITHARHPERSVAESKDLLSAGSSTGAREESRSFAALRMTNVSGKAPRGNPLKRWIADLLLPDPQVGWLPFAGPAAERIVRQGAIDAVIITVPPFSSVLLAKRLRAAFPDLTIVLDFRDEWLDTTLLLVSLNANPRARLIAEQTEREAVEAATCVVAVTDAARDAIRARYQAQPGHKFVSISNGYDGAPPTAPAPLPRKATDAPVTLTYLGSVYGSTEPTSFVEAVLGLSPEMRARLRVRFVGHCERPEDRETLLQLGSTVELIGFLPQADALRLLDETDYVLLLSHDPVNVSAKFYDYLRAAKPMLAAVHPAGDVRRRLQETRAGRWADIGDPEAIRAMLVDALTAPPADCYHPDFVAIARYHRRPLARQYAVLLQELATEQTAPELAQAGVVTR